MGAIGEVRERDGEVWNPNYCIYISLIRGLDMGFY
jgi:hypothetical protein